MFGVEEEIIDRLSAEIDKLKAENSWLKTKVVHSIIEVKSWYPESVFPKDGKSIDCKSADMARLTCDNILAKWEEALKGGSNE